MKAPPLKLGVQKMSKMWMLLQDTGTNASRQKQLISTTITSPYYLKFYSLKCEIQALASLWPLFWKTGTERPSSSVYSIICSHYSTDSQEPYENSLGYICESYVVFMRVVSFKCNLQCYSHWIIFGITCVLKISTCSSLYLMIKCHSSSNLKKI